MLTGITLWWESRENNRSCCASSIAVLAIRFRPAGCRCCSAVCTRDYSGLPLLCCASTQRSCVVWWLATLVLSCALANAAACRSSVQKPTHDQHLSATVLLCVCLCDCVSECMCVDVYVCMYVCVWGLCLATVSICVSGYVSVCLCVCVGVCEGSVIIVLSCTIVDLGAYRSLFCSHHS